MAKYFARLCWCNTILSSVVTDYAHQQDCLIKYLAISRIMEISIQTYDNLHARVKKLYEYTK